MLQAIRSNARQCAALVLLAFTTAVASPVAHAGIVGTEPALAAASHDAERARLVETLQRAEVRELLVARGVDPALVEARIAALTSDEVVALNARFEELPAGGDVVGTVVFIFLILLITDLLGWTHIFPFTNKGAIGD